MKLNSLADILEQLRRKYPELSRRLSEAKAIERWEKAVGPVMAKQSRVVAVRDQTLMVEVAHPVWRSELHHCKRQILDRLNSGEGEVLIDDLFFVEPGRGRARDKDSKAKGSHRSRFKK